MPDRNWESDGKGNVTKVTVTVGYAELDGIIKELKHVPSYFKASSRQAVIGGIEFVFERPADSASDTTSQD